MKKNKKKIDLIKVGSIAVTSILIMMIFAILVSILFIMNLLKDKPEFDVARFNNLQSTKIFDKNDNLVSEIGMTIRENVEYDQIPSSLIDAFVATEDSRYFEHNGFDMARFVKAIGDNVIGVITRKRSGLSGASTVTMQLVKNTYFTDDQAGIEAERSGVGGIERKFQEIALALELERNLDKKSIFELYINKMNYGANGRGIENAAKYYFNKSASELNLSESALLAGVINSPYYYNPFNYLEHATSRRNTVLRLMLRHGFITQKEYNLASSIKVEDLLQDPYANKSGKGNPYQAYIDTVIKEIEELTNLSPYSNPMIVYTHLDTTVQEQMDKIQKGETNDYIDFFDDLVEMASIAVDNQSGAIIGVLGGRNYAGGGSLLLNHATEQYKQPGSSIKTILEYPLAFDKLGWSTSHVVLDSPLFYRGTNVLIGNAIGRYHGQIRLKDAVSLSLNTTAISTFQEVIDKTSVEEVVEYMNKMGYHQVNKDNFNIQFAIGGANLETSVLQQAGAQAAIMNGGVYHKPHTIRKIEFLNGRDPITPVYEGVRTLSPAAAFQTTELLKNNLINGFGYAYTTLRGYSNTIYAKSGTSDWGVEGLDYNIPRGASKDIWIIASTADHTIATWSGYEKAIKDKDTYFDNNKLVANLSGKATELIIDSIKKSLGEPRNAVDIPDDITTIEHILATYPYASVIPDMNPELIAYGYIDRKFASLVSPEQLKIENLESFEATIDANGKATLTWSIYPEKEKTVAASNEMDISIKNGDSVVYGATGTRLFDYTWVYGPIRYKAKVFVNDQEMAQLKHDSELMNVDINLTPGSNIKVCGYYGFENKDIHSNEICKEFKVEDRDVSISFIPYSGNTVTDVQEKYTKWATANGTKVQFHIVYKDKQNTTTSEIKLANVTKNNISELVKASTLASTTYDVYIYTNSDCRNGVTDNETGKCSLCDAGFHLDNGTCIKD